MRCKLMPAWPLWVIKDQMVLFARGATEPYWPGPSPAWIIASCLHNTPHPFLFQTQKWFLLSPLKANQAGLCWLCTECCCMDAGYSSGESAKCSGARGVGSINLNCCNSTSIFGKIRLSHLKKTISHFLSSKSGHKFIIPKNFNLDMNYLLLES